MVACSKRSGVVFIPPYGAGLYIMDTKKNNNREAVADGELKIAREEIGRVLEQLARCEHEAYDGSNALDYDKLLEQIQQIKQTVHRIATQYLHTSFESRFLAVNVLDAQLDDATKMHFMSRAQGSFWTVYQQIKGWRACLLDVLRELGR